MDIRDPDKRLSFLAEKIKKLTQAQQDHKLLLDEFQGVAFLCGDESFIISLTSIIEILPCPALARVTGVKDWFLGLINLRGDIIPVTDLQNLLYHIRTNIEKNTPVLIVQHQGELSGILVNKIIALYNITQSEPIPFSLLPSCVFAPYSTQVVQHEDEIFPLFDVVKLVEDPIFSNI